MDVYEKQITHAMNETERELKIAQMQVASLELKLRKAALSAEVDAKVAASLRREIADAAFQRDYWQTTACYWRDMWFKQMERHDRAIEAVRYLVKECDPERNGFNAAFPEFKHLSQDPGDRDSDHLPCGGLREVTGGNIVTERPASPSSSAPK